MNKTSHRVAAIGISFALVIGPGLAAMADDDAGPPAHVLEKAKEGFESGQSNALAMLAIAIERNPSTGIPDHAQGTPPHLYTGLERAQIAVGKAVEKLKGWQKDHPGNGNAYGNGRAEKVHEALAAELSPSGLDSHGQKVSAMVKAVEAFTDEKPGRGLGRNNKGGDDEGDDD